MVTLRFELSSASLTSAFVASSLNNHSRAGRSFSFVQLGQVASSPAIGMVANGWKTTVEGICTADELHYVPVLNSDWRAALWRYLPSPTAMKRNHPLLLLSGVGTNAIGYDLSPESSFARFMSGQGFDTWILELRGAGLSSRTADQSNTDIDKTGGRPSNDQQQIVLGLLENLISVSQGLENVLDGGNKILQPQDRLSKRVQDFKQRIEHMPHYNWDFDNYLEEDVPSAVRKTLIILENDMASGHFVGALLCRMLSPAMSSNVDCWSQMEYVRTQSKPKDGKLLAIGHSMGGILLYAMLSRCGFKGMDSGLASVTTLASAFDYSSSGTFLKYLLPVAEPAQAFNVPIIPMDAMFNVAYPLMCRPPFALSWINPNISAPQMMNDEMFEKLVLNNFCTVPTKLLLQLSTAVEHGGLRDRTGTFYYKDHISKTNVPILALAGDWDIICPPEAVYDTVKLIPKHLATFKVLGSPGGPHYGHQDLIGGRTVPNEVCPLIVQFLQRHDEV